MATSLNFSLPDVIHFNTALSLNFLGSFVSYLIMFLGGIIASNYDCLTLLHDAGKSGIVRGMIVNLLIVVYNSPHSVSNGKC